MRVVFDKSEWDEKAVVATIGFFDGVHRGHLFLLQEMQILANEHGVPSAVITFPVHPRIVLHSDYQPKLLNTFDEKIDLLSKTGIDYVIIMDFTPSLAALSARAFISSVLVPEWHVQKLLVGYDHHFGRQRADSFEQFSIDGKEYGLDVIRIPSYDNNDGKAICSSMIRSLIEAGEVVTASQMLGYHYRLKGHVVRGNKIGRLLGFPTANIEVDEPYKVIPKNGSYAVRITIDGKQHIGMLYIGSRPTIDMDDSLRIEAHIFDFSKDIYQEPITIEFLDFIRDDRKFDTIEELRDQMEKDKKIAIVQLDL